MKENPNTSSQLNSNMFICDMYEYTFNQIVSLKPIAGLFSRFFK